MGKNVHNDVLDGALNVVKTRSLLLAVLSAEPTGSSAYTNATTKHQSSGYNIADVAISASDFTGPADGDSSGRKLTVNAQSSISIDGPTSAASATHVALVDNSTSTAVLYTTTCTTQSLSNGNKVNTPAWDIEIRDPT